MTTTANAAFPNCPHCQQPYRDLPPISVNNVNNRNNNVNNQLAPVVTSAPQSLQDVIVRRHDNGCNGNGCKPRKAVSPIQRTQANAVAQRVADTTAAMLPKVSPAAEPKSRLISPTPADILPAVLAPAGLPGKLVQVNQFSQATNNKQHDATETVTDDIFDHPLVAGKVCICVLLYGDYVDLHKQCVNAILSTVPETRRSLRLIFNAVGQQTLEYAYGLQQAGQVSRSYVFTQNAKKYPAMRMVFHDSKHPITEKWTIWFDDDSIANKDMRWCQKLMAAAVASYEHGVRMLGDKYIWTFSNSQLDWLKSRPWYRGRPWQLKNSQEAPNGNRITFPTGGFWAIHTESIQAADIPDVQIGNNGGDYMIAAQLWQAGYSVKMWNHGKRFVTSSSVPRRGLSEIHTGQPGWIPGGCSK